MTEALGDYAERVAQQLTVDSAAPVAEATTLTEEVMLEDDTKLFSKIRFTWRAEDRATLDRIQMSAEAMFDQAFADAIDALDWFYLQLRVPATKDGQLLTDAMGRTVWVQGPDDKPLESWSQLTGQDIEQTLVNLDRIRFTLVPQVNKLFLEALYARHVSQDIYDEKWTKVMDGTQGDKTASSNKESRVDRYHAFFRFYLYSVAKTFLDEITAFQKRLTNVRYWQVNAQKG